jgi:hypothetical protein
LIIIDITIPIRHRKIGKLSVQPTAFETLVMKLGLEERDWPKSERLRKWVSSHRNSRYVPESLLGTWNMRLRVDKL